jgi:hypothetical protein
MVCQEKKGSFGAIYWWMVKLGTALAGLVIRIDYVLRWIFS